MSPPDILSNISDVLVLLAAPVTATEEISGWTLESKDVARTYLLGLQSALKSGEILPPLGVVRGLDHRGVTGGELLEVIAAISNHAGALGVGGAQL